MARRRESGLKFGDQEKKNAKQSRKERKAEQSGEFVMQPKKRHWGVLIAVTAVLLVAGVLVYLIARGNERLRITKVVVADARVPEAFDGFRILQLSDFNGKSFGEGNRTLIETVAAEDFDIAVLTGDYIAPGGSLDSFEPVARLVEALTERGKPVYYVLGENDARKPEKAPDGWNR
ncbi:MAG: metallophosphoesterase, partial [Clostridia bacterium]|nr:metallophosphoesterase [Clostridia bacterium]